MNEPICYAYKARILDTGEPVGVYHLPASVPRKKRRGKAYHMAFLDLRDCQYPKATSHQDVPILSVRRSPEYDDYKYSPLEHLNTPTPKHSNTQTA